MFGYLKFPSCDRDHHKSADDKEQVHAEIPKLKNVWKKCAEAAVFLFDDEKMEEDHKKYSDASKSLNIFYLVHYDGSNPFRLAADRY